MARPHPGPRALLRPGAVLLCGSLVATLSACGEDLPELGAADAEACQDVVAGLPETLMGSDLTDRTDRVATYDEVTVTCGVEKPEDYAPTAECHEVDGVGWYVPASSLGNLDEDLVAYALSHEPYVRLEAPASQRLESTDDALFEIAAAVKETLGEGLACL